MQRVHRNLSREETQVLRDRLNELVPDGSVFVNNSDVDNHDSL